MKYAGLPEGAELIEEPAESEPMQQGAPVTFAGMPEGAEVVADTPYVSKTEQAAMKKYGTGAISPDEWDRMGRPGGVAPVDQRENATFGEKVAKTISNIPGDVVDVARGIYGAVRHPVDTGTGLVKMAAGGLAEGAAALGADTPEIQEMRQSFEPVKEAAKSLAKNPVDFIAGRIIEHPAQTAMDLMLLKGAANKLVGTVPTQSYLAAKEMEHAVASGMNKGVRPTVTGKTTAGQSAGYYKKAKDAVSSIIENKGNLQYSTGEAGELPKSLSQFSEAIDQTKKAIFSQYDDMARTAGEQGAAVKTTTIAMELDKVIKNKVIQDLHPELIDKARALQKTLWKRKTYTAQEAQEAIASLNESLQAYYKNPSYASAKSASLDAMVANQLRKSLDASIDAVSGPGYQVLKHRYGALKTIEKEVNQRALVDARKNVKGLIDFTDVASAADLTRGVLSMSPGYVASAGAMQVVKNYFKRLNDPNTHIADMFSKSEKYMTPPSLGSVAAGKLKGAAGPTAQAAFQASRASGVSEELPDLVSSAEAADYTGDLSGTLSARNRALQDAASDSSGIVGANVSRASQDSGSARPAMTAAQRAAFNEETKRLRDEQESRNKPQTKGKKSYIPVKQVTVQTKDGEMLMYRDAKGKLYDYDPNEE